MCFVSIQIFYLISTLRSWVHKMFSHFRILYLVLGDKYVSKCSSDSFPHTKYMSPCVENSQNHTLIFRFSPIPGRRFEKQGKLWDRFFQSFPCFLNLLPGIGEKTKHQYVVLRVFNTWWHIFCVWKTVKTTFWRIVVSQSRGDCSKMWEHFMDSGSQSET